VEERDKDLKAIVEYLYDDEASDCRNIIPDAIANVSLEKWERIAAGDWKSDHIFPQFARVARRYLREGEREKY
jgi:hypothetical protein